MAKYVKYKVTTGTNMVDHRYNTGRWAPGETKLVIEDDVAAAMVANLPDVFELAADQITVGGGSPFNANNGLILNDGDDASSAWSWNVQLNSQGSYYRSSGYGSFTVGADLRSTGYAATTLGENNINDADNSSMFGNGHTADVGSYSAAVFGTYNAMVGSYGAAMFGGNNQANNAQFSATAGQYANNTIPYSICYAGGQDTQRRFNCYHVPLAGSTNNDTPANLRLGPQFGGQEGITLQADTSYAVDVLLVARSVEADDNATAGYKITALIKRDEAGNTTLVGTPAVTVLGEDTVSWDATVVADDTNDRLQVQVTGEAGVTISWVADVRLAAVTMA